MINAPATQKKYFSKKYIFVFAFNLIVGFGFFVGIGPTYRAVGNWTISLMVICALISFVVGLCYARLVNKFSQYGGAYNFVEPIAGKTGAFAVGWINYFVCPFAILVSLIGIIWAFSNTGSIFGVDILTTYKVEVVVSAVTIFLIICVILNYGITTTKIATYILWFFKWSLIISILILCLVFLIKACVENGANSFVVNLFGGDSYTKNSQSYHPHFGIMDYISALMTLFFSFGGIEAVVSVSEDVEDPKKTMPKIVLSTVVALSVFYIFVFYALLLALGGHNQFNTGLADTPDGQSAPNSINAIISNLKDHKMLATTGGVLVGIGIFSILAQICNKLAGVVSVTWSGSRSLLPLAINKTIPQAIAKQDAKGRYNNAIRFNTLIVTILLTIYLSLALSIDSILHNLENTFGAMTLMQFTQYIIVLGVGFVYFRKKILSIKFYEAYAYIAVACILLFFMIVYFIFGIKDGTIWFQLGSYTIIMLIGFCIFFINKIHNNKKKI